MGWTTEIHSRIESHVTLLGFLFENLLSNKYNSDLSNHDREKSKDSSIRDERVEIVRLADVSPIRISKLIAVVNGIFGCFWTVSKGEDA